MTETYLGPKEVAERLNVSVRHARRLIREQMLHLVLGRGVVRVSPKAFETFLRRAAEQPTARSEGRGRGPHTVDRKAARSKQPTRRSREAEAVEEEDGSHGARSSSASQLLVPIEPRTRSRRRGGAEES